VTAAGPTGADGEEEGEVESGMGDDSFHESAEGRPPTAAAVRAAPRKKRDMAGTGARGGEEVWGALSLCALAVLACAE